MLTNQSNTYRNNLINHRPITYATGNETGPLPLTPNDFLLPNSLLTTTDKLEATKVIFTTALTSNNNTLQRFWKRWKDEYLTLLNTNNRSSNKQKLCPGDICLLEEGAKRQFWPLVVIEEIYPGRDGHARSARIKVHGKVIRRPMKLLYRLEIPDQ